MSSNHGQREPAGQSPEPSNAADWYKTGFIGQLPGKIEYDSEAGH